MNRLPQGAGQKPVYENRVNCTAASGKASPVRQRTVIDRVTLAED